MSMSVEQWAEVRRVWEADSRTGYKWLVTELNLSITDQAVRYQAITQQWVKDSDVMTALYGPLVDGGNGYRAGFAAAAAKFAALGVSEAEIAALFEVPAATLSEWKAAHPALNKAIEAGGLLADGRVAEQLLKCATGYEYQAEEIAVIDGQIKRVPVTIQVQPDPQAAIFWFNNRQSRGANE